MATKDCTFFVDIDGRQVEMDFDGFRAYLMQDGVMATLAPDLTAKRGKKAGFTVTAQKAEPTPARAEAPKARAEGTTKKTEAPAPTELEVSAENLRKLMPKLSKARAEAIIAVMKAMGIPFDRLKLAKGKVEAKGTLQQADVKARDAEYMAAVKAGDTAKAQRMVEEAAKAAGYNETGSHGLAKGRLEGNAFDLERLGSNTGAASARLGFFFGSKETARTYAQVQINPEKAEQVASMARDIITPLLDVVPKGASRELDFARDNIETLFSPKSPDILEPESYVTGVYAEVTRLLDEALEVAEGYGSTGLTLNLMADEANKAVALLKKQSSVQEVVGPNGESLTDTSFSAFDVEDDDVAGFSTYLKDIASSLRSQYPAVAKAFKDAAAKGDAFMSPKEQSLRDTLREAHEKLDNTLGHVPFYAILDTAQVDAVLQMENPLVHDQQGVRYREQTYHDIIQQAKKRGHDSVIIKNTYDGGPLDDIKVVFEPKQIKSADPITYDDKGNVIPLSERFKPESPDIRYQEEASPLGSITFIDDLNALISVFEKANFSTVLHEAMHFYRRHMLNTENGFTADEIKRFERWAGAKDGKWTVAAEEKAARAFEKYLRDGIAPIPELRDLFRKVARWMREVYATLTRSPVDIDIPADIRQVFDRIFTLEAERQRKAGGQAAPAAGTQSLQQADTKARDAEYMAAVEAGDTAKAQKMVDEAAKAAGYTEKAYHATNRQFTIFNADAGRYTYPVTSPKAIYFTSSKEEASFWADVKSQSSGQPIVLPVYLRPSISSRYPKPVQRVDAGGVPADQLRVSRTNADMIILENVKEFGGDALVTDYVVFSPNQIKSADPITYDDKGNVIPLSQRFNPKSPDIRYQREGEGVPQAETATAAYRRAMKERQQERAAKALRRLGQKKGEPATFVSAQPRPSLEITPVNRRAVIETMQELREFRKDLDKRGVDIADANEADLEQWEKLLNRVEQLGGVNPITPQMDAAFVRVAQQGATSPDAIRLIEDAAKKAFGISKLVAGNTHTRTIQAPLALDEKQEILKALNRKTTSGQLSLDVQRVLLDRRYDVKGAWARSKNWRQTLEDYLTGNDERFSESQKRELKAYVQDVVNEMRQFTKQVPVKATDVFQTGKPVLASVYRGGDLVGNEFQERFLGLFTGAPSAKMGYFFAGRSETSSNYSSNVQRYVVAMYNPLVFDFKGDRQRVARLSQVIRDAYADGHDGVIAVNIYDPAPIDNVFIIPPGGENRIKSYGLTSREEGLIPLSERFNPTTKNVLYQGEDPLPNVEGTSTEAFRRKQAEQRQKNLIDAMNRLRQGQAQAPKGEPKAAQPKAATEPSQARQGQTTAPRAAKTAASTPRRGFGGKSLDDIFDALLKQAKAGQLGVSKEAPATPSELLEERIKRGLRDVLDAVYNKRVQPESAVDTARNSAANLLAAHQAGEQSAIDAATAEFRQVVSESRKAARGPQAPRPPRPKATVAERYAKMMGRINEKPKPAAKATPAELAEMTVRQLLRRMEKQLKVAKSQGIDVEQMEVNGATVSRKEFFVNAADEYQDAYVKQDVPRQQAAYDRMRMAVDTIVTSLQKGKSRPLWHGLRSPLSYANVIGSYEGVMGQLGAEISELFKRTRTDINNKVMTFSEGMSFLQEQMNKVYKPLMKAQGYYGMPAIIDEHIKYLRFTAAFSARYMKIRQEQSIFKDPKAWYTTRRELSRELIDGQSAAFPMAAAMIKSVVYTAKLKYNLKSASTNYISLALSVGPYMRANELADIIYEAAKPSTWNRKVAGDRTLRDVAVGETGGRQAEGTLVDEGLTHWWHRRDIFQLSSEHVRIAGYLVGERMAEREDQKLRAEGKAPLSDYVKARLIRDWIEKVEFDNSPWNIAPWFRGPKAGIVLQFKPFLQKNVERFIADLQRDPEAFVLSDPRTPLGQITSKIPWKYRRVIGTIGQQVMWGGIGSLLTAVPYLKPLAGVFILAGLMNALKGMTDDDEFAEDLAIGIYYGAPAAIGVDLSSSLGFFEEAYGKTIHEQVVNFSLGPFVGTGVNVAQKQYEYWEAAQKEPRLGGEEEKRKELMRRGIDIAKQVTPYVRMLESAIDLAQGEGSTMRLDKEEELTKWETAIRALGGAPLKQTMFFDEKEAYGWQKSLLGKPTGFERLKKKEGESDASYFRRKAKTDQWERTYLRRLEQNPRYRRLKPEEQEAVRENLWRNFAEESGKLRPDTSKFDASGLLERRAERVRSR